MTTNGKYQHPPPGFVVPPTAGFRSMHHILAENLPVYTCLAVLNQDEFRLLPIDTLQGKPREEKKKKRRKKFDRRGSTDGPGEMYLLKKRFMRFSVQTPRIVFSMTVLSTNCKMPYRQIKRQKKSSPQTHKIKKKQKQNSKREARTRDLVGRTESNVLPLDLKTRSQNKQLGGGGVKMFRPWKNMLSNKWKP